MSLVKGDTPRWVSQLHSPPASKQKVNGISDPNGYPSSQSSGSKVRTSPPYSVSRLFQ